MRAILLTLTFITLYLTGCTTTEEVPTPTVPPACGQTRVLDNVDALDCFTVSPETTLIQTADGAQSMVVLNAIQITVSGTMAIHQTTTQIVFAVIEGTGVVSSGGRTRIIQPGAQIILTENNPRPGSLVPFDLNLMASLPLNRLPRSLQVPPPVAAPPGYVSPTPVTNVQPAQPAPENTQEALATDCTPRPDWTETYAIQPGDTLYNLAIAYEIEVSELQAGNCITNADRIVAGQVIRLPVRAVTATPTAEPPAEDTPTPSAVAFRADQTEITNGTCTTLRWDVFNVSSVTLDGETVAANGEREVCPTETTEYTLVVTYPDGTESNRSITVAVNGS